MEKKIYLEAYTKGNISALYEYYLINLKGKYKDRLEVDYTERKNYGKFKMIFNRIYRLLKRYDFTVSDYSMLPLKFSRDGMYMCHGYGTKCSPGKNEKNNFKDMFKYKMLLENTSYLVTLSKKEEEYYLNPKDVPSKKRPRYLDIGLPRNDKLLSKSCIKEIKEKIVKELSLEGKKILLYSPTWRGYEFEKEFFFSIHKLKKLNEFLEESNYILLYRPHPFEETIPLDRVSGLGNIIHVGMDIVKDTQDILMCSDMLITDYSSIFVDYLLLDKPIIFFDFDREEYISHRGIVIDFENQLDTPGLKSKSLDELIENIKETFENEEYYKQMAIKSKKQFHTNFAGNSAEKIWDCIIKKILREED